LKQPALWCFSALSNFCRRSPLSGYRVQTIEMPSAILRTVKMLIRDQDAPAYIVRGYELYVGG